MESFHLLQGQKCFLFHKSLHRKSINKGCDQTQEILLKSLTSTIAKTEEVKHNTVMYMYM